MLSNLHTLTVPDHGALIVLLAALMGLLWGLRNSATRKISHQSLWLSIGFGSLSLLCPCPLRWLSFGLSVASVGIYRAVSSKDPREEPPASGLFLGLFTILGIGLTTFLLLYRLAPNLNLPLVWESTVILSFLPEVKDLNITNALGSRFLWTEGLLSEGDYALVYGFPTALLLSAHSSLFSLRIVSVLSFLASVLLLGLLCKRFSSKTAGVAALIALGMNLVGLIFGRYGSSIAGTLFSVTLALYCCATCVARPTVARVIAAGLAMFIATLGYAPARLVVLVLAISTLLGIITNTGASSRRRALLCGLLVLGVVSTWLFERRYERTPTYASARQEQFFGLFYTGLWPDSMQPQWEAFQRERRQPSLSDYLDFATELLTTWTIPHLLDLTSPFSDAPDYTRAFTWDPLQKELYEPFLFPFLLLGLVICSRRSSKWFHRVLLGWIAMSTIPILFTNRVDTYRTSMALIPISVYIAIGVAEALAELRRTKFPALISTALLCVALVIATKSLSESLSAPTIKPPLTDLILENAEPRFIHKAILGVEERTFRHHAQTQLIIFRREQVGLPVPSGILSNENYQALTSETMKLNIAKEIALSELASNLNAGYPVILGPRLAVSESLDRLAARGFKVYPLSIEGHDLAVILK